MEMWMDGSDACRCIMRMQMVRGFGHHVAIPGLVVSCFNCPSLIMYLACAFISNRIPVYPLIFCTRGRWLYGRSFLAVSFSGANHVLSFYKNIMCGNDGVQELAEGMLY